MHPPTPVTASTSSSTSDHAGNASNSPSDSICPGSARSPKATAWYSSSYETSLENQRDNDDDDDATSRPSLGPYLPLSSVLHALFSRSILHWFSNEMFSVASLETEALGTIPATSSPSSGTSSSTSDHKGKASNSAMLIAAGPPIIEAPFGDSGWSLLCLSCVQGCLMCMASLASSLSVISPRPGRVAKFSKACGWSWWSGLRKLSRCGRVNAYSGSAD
ncbi:hypothetical protein J1614_008573 [Plenodomus biglobosus]|nr:hypothetical protein J1614_008573 [Plenodomus biglobosus]